MPTVPDDILVPVDNQADNRDQLVLQHKLNRHLEKE